MLPYAEARRKVIEAVTAAQLAPRCAYVELGQALGCVLAEEVHADRDYPPFDRSTRDGFAVRAADTARPPVTLEVVAEVRAGGVFTGQLRSGQCVQIMTGAGMPAGADAVVMIEHTKQATGSVEIERSAEAGENVVPRGSEAKAEQLLLKPGARLGYAELALLGQVGHVRVKIAKPPRVAILSTGDEIGRAHV